MELGKVTVLAKASRKEFDRRAIPCEAAESLWSARDGWHVRRIDWPAPKVPRGSILFLPGRGDAYEKYLETLAGWRAEGWNVTAADWRGQAGSGRLGKDAVTGHVSDFALWVDDLAALWADWTAQTPGPHVLAAHSMGGHIAMRALVEHRLAPDAAVLVAPMLGLHTYGLPMGLLHAAAKLMCRLGDPMRPAWKWSEKPGQLPQGRDALLTHDAARYADEEFWRTQRPEIVMGPGSWRWVERAYTSCAAIFRKGGLEGVKVPVLMLATSRDALVAYKAIAQAAQRLPRCELVSFGKEARHEILREVDAVRDIAFGRINEFLDREAPLPK